LSTGRIKSENFFNILTRVVLQEVVPGVPCCTPSDNKRFALKKYLTLGPDRVGPNNPVFCDGYWVEGIYFFNQRRGLAAGHHLVAVIDLTRP